MESAAVARCWHFTIVYVVVAAVAMTTSIQTTAADSARWGLDDVTATVGVLFRYRVTSRLSYAIDDSCVAQLKINEMGKETVPSWLTIELDACGQDETSDCDVYIEGVPGPENSRQRVFMSVRYVRLCRDTTENGEVSVNDIDNADVFIIDVQNDDDDDGKRTELHSEVDDRHLEAIQCRPGKTVTTAVVTIEGSMSQMSAADRVAILRRFADHLQLPVSVIRLLPSSSVIDIGSTVLVAGPGSADHLKPLWAHSVVSTDINQWSDAAMLRWTVGCGNVLAAYMSVLERLELTALDGSLSVSVRRPVIGWHVANRLAPSQQRFKRRLSRLLIQATATPQQSSAVRPTANNARATVVPEVAMTSSQISPTRWNGRSTVPTSVFPTPGFSTKEQRRMTGSPLRPIVTAPATDDVAFDVTKPWKNLEPSVSDVSQSIGSHVQATSPLPHSNRQAKVLAANQKRHTTVAAPRTVVKKTIKRVTSNTPTDVRTTNNDVMYASPDTPSIGGSSETFVTSYFNQPTSDAMMTTYTSSAVSEAAMSSSDLNSTTVSQLSRHKTVATKKTVDGKRPNKVTRKMPMKSASIVSITTATIAYHLTPTTENPHGAKSDDLMTSPEDLASDVTSPHSKATTEAITTYDIDFDLTSEALTTDGVSSPSIDVIVRSWAATTSESSRGWTTESTVGAVTSPEDSVRFSNTNELHSKMTTTATSTPLPKTTLDSTNLATSLPPTVPPTEVSSTRRVPPSTMSSTTAQTTTWPTKLRTSYWPNTPTSSHTMRTRRPPKKTKPRRPSGTKWTAAVPPGHPDVRHNSRCNNNAPVIKNPIGKLTLEAGSVLTFQIANDTFVDCEDGNTSRLQLLLTSAQYMTLPPNSWIKLNGFTRTLYGLPLDIHVGHHEFILAAIDSDGKIARCPFEVHVRRRLSTPAISHEVSVVINVDYQLFAQLVDKRIDVANKIGSAFGDRDPTQYIVVTRLAPGSVIYTWTNSSLRLRPGAICPLQEITALASHIQHRDGTLNERFVRMMRPYSIQNASVVPHGPCQAAFRSPQRGPSQHPSVGIVDEVKPIQVQSRPRDVDVEPVNYDSLLYILIPLVVLAVVLIILLIIICCREIAARSATKDVEHTKIPSSSSSSSALSSIRCSSRGIPVIFAEELVDGYSGGDGSVNYYTGNRRDRVVDDTPFTSSPPDYKASVKHHLDWNTTAGLSSADNRVRDNKSLLVSDDEETDDDDGCNTIQGSGHHGGRCHNDSLRYRSADRRTRAALMSAERSVEQTAGSRGLRPPTQPACYSGNSPPPPYVPTYAL